MSSIQGWHMIMDRFQKRLSRWKANMLSIDGRMVLLTSVLGALGVRLRTFWRQIGVNSIGVLKL
ncbi:hypothetical protein HanHA300_Chr09g0298961 [Helianthus annuus]|nr:hypothetical protein HanHA300_Chr09g0298961 [Helianthus annuus]KAJ0540505.1 hypothetical protein HanHA89_Chr09g0317581 [Helianthus annuus]KAJ0709808.1 hypothetical protein HanOQP8_Chr09g0304891 [Helianthus annuus]